MHRNMKFDVLLDTIDDIDDILEYVQEIFEIENETTRSLLCNALLSYFFLPVVVQSLAGTKQSFEHTCNQIYKVSVNTALFMLDRTCKNITFQPLINSICIALLSQTGPKCLVQPQFEIQNPFFGQPEGFFTFQPHCQWIDLLQDPPTFSAKWKCKLPSQFKAGDLGSFLAEYYNQSCVEYFLLNPKFERCIFSALYNRIKAIEHIVEQKSKQLSLEKSHINQMNKAASSAQPTGGQLQPEENSSSMVKGLSEELQTL